MRFYKISPPSLPNDLHPKHEHHTRTPLVLHRGQSNQSSHRSEHLGPVECTPKPQAQGKPSTTDVPVHILQQEGHRTPFLVPLTHLRKTRLYSR